MSRTTTVAKRAGAAALAAATIVTGLSFGSAATAAPTEARMTGKLVSPTGATSAFKIYEFNPAVRWSAGSLSEAESSGTSWSFPAYGEAGPIMSPNGNCWYVGSRDWAIYLTTCSGAANQQFRLEPAGDEFYIRQASGGKAVGWNSPNSVTVASNNTSLGFGSRYVQPDAPETRPLTARLSSFDKAARTATVTGTATPGAAIRHGGKKVATADAATGEWSAVIPNLTLEKHTLTFEQRVDGTKIDTATVEVDMSARQLTAEVKFDSDVTKRATVTGLAEPKAEVRITDADDKVLGTATADSLSGRYTVQVPAPNKGGDYPVTITQKVGADDAGTLGATVQYGAAVKITSPADGADFDGGKVTVSGTGVDGGSVKLREQGSADFIGSGTVADGAFSIESTVNLDNDKHVLEVIQTGKGNNTTTDTVTVNPDGNIVDLTARGAFDDDLTRNATISGEADPDATVTLYDASNKVVGTTTAANGTYSFDIATPSEGGVHKYSVTQTPTGKPESAQVQVELDYGQNTGLTVTSPANGSTISNVRPTFTGAGTTGATIEIREKGALVATTTVKDGAWRVPASANLDYAKHDVVVTQITKGNLRSQQNLSFTIEKAQEESPLTAKIDSVDDVARTAKISGHATPDALIKRDGKVIATADATTGAWSATVTDLKVGQNPVTLDQFVRGAKKDSKTLDIEVKQTQFPFAVTAPANDSVVRTADKQVTFTGTGKPGGKVSVNYGSRNIGTAFVDIYGDWKFTATMNYADYDLTVYYKQNPTGALTSQQPLHITVTNNEQNNPFVVTAPANDAVIAAPDKQVTFEGTGTTGGTVTIKHGAKTVGTGSVDDNGKWKFTSTMNFADYNLTAYYKKTPTSGAVQQKLHIVVTDGAVVKPFTVTTPTDGSTVETENKQVTFRGEGAGNGLVKIVRGSRVVAQGTVGTNGQWVLSGELNYGSYDVTVYHKPVGSKTADSKVLNLTVAPPAKDFEISTPSNGATVPGGPITFTGSGKDGGTVSAFLNSKKRAEGTVQGNTWTMTTAAITTPGTHTFTIYYKANPASQIADAYPITITIK